MMKLWRRLGALVALALTTLTPWVLWAAEEGHGGHDAEIHVNWWSRDMVAPPVGWYFVDFVIFVFALVYLTRKPIRGAFLARHNAIKRAIDDNQAAFDTAKTDYDKTRDKLAAVDREVGQLIAKVKEDGAFERERIIESAKTYSARMRDDVKGIIANEATAAKTRLQRAVAEQALATAERLLVANITDADRVRMVDEAIVEIEKVESLAVAAQRRRVTDRTAVGGEK
jgi:F0F1-type ATP synthase membrane subunit b/b'